MLVSVWLLQQDDPSQLLPPHTPTRDVVLTRLLRPSAELASFLYRTVGAEWGWRSRLEWDTTHWESTLAEPGRELWIGWHQGRPVGYSELVAGDGDDRGSSRIKYLGLFPDRHGQGLGGHLLTQAARRAWTINERVNVPPVRRVVLDTSQLDSPTALANYRARGFRVVSCTQEQRGA